MGEASNAYGLTLFTEP